MDSSFRTHTHTRTGLRLSKRQGFSCAQTGAHDKGLRRNPPSPLPQRAMNQAGPASPLFRIAVEASTSVRRCTCCGDAGDRAPLMREFASAQHFSPRVCGALLLLHLSSSSLHKQCENFSNVLYRRRRKCTDGDDGLRAAKGFLLSSPVRSTLRTRFDRFHNRYAQASSPFTRQKIK